MSSIPKFRAWWEENKCYFHDVGVMPHGNLVINRNHPDARYLPTEKWSAPYEELPTDVILELSTGFKDKNGEEIYDGDVLNNDDEVFWDSLCGCWSTTNGFITTPLSFIAKKATITGNIHNDSIDIKEENKNGKTKTGD